MNVLADKLEANKETKMPNLMNNKSIVDYIIWMAENPSNDNIKELIETIIEFNEKLIIFQEQLKKTKINLNKLTNLPHPSSFSAELPSFSAGFPFQSCRQ